MDQEPHHHLALRNDYVKVFRVEVLPGDSIVLHRHDQDTIAIAIGDQEVTVGIPGKPDIHQKNADAQVRLQRGGYVHSTHVDGDKPYRTIAVELLQPQTDFQNLCIEILPGQPLGCPDVSAKAPSGFTSQPLLASNETRVRLVRVLPHQSMNLTGFPTSQLIVALDAAIMGATSEQPEEALQPGDFVWLDNGRRRAYQNRSDNAARFIQILFAPEK
jgi:quercetin dioxygenase-like cupin family protein